ncbi:MAG: hypothetical protein J6M12_02785 [Clostridia bacterium]|nr:hypothetical protein [Clostridia bacterium]
MKNKKTCRLLSLALVLLTLFPLLCACGGTAGVSYACTGYSAALMGEQEERSFKNTESLLLPPELVRAMTLFAATELGLESREDAARIVYDFSGDLGKVYMKKVVDTAGGAEALLEKMNALVDEWGLHRTSFGSLTGAVNREKELYALMKLDDPAFESSLSTTSDLLIIGQKIYENDLLRPLFATRVYRLEGEKGDSTRRAPLLDEKDDRYLENTLFYIGGSVVDGAGKRTAAGVAAVEEKGKIAFAATSSYSGNEDPVLYLSADLGNLCGKLHGKSYDLSVSPEGSQVVEDEEGTVFLGTNLFYVIMFFFLVIVGVLALLGIAISIYNVIKRNREGRRKYAPPKE